MANMTECSVRLCGNPSEGESPITRLPLCNQHMQVDLLKCEELQTTVAEKVSNFKRYQNSIRLMQQRLASDLQSIEDTFLELKDTLDKYQGEIRSAIDAHHEELLGSLKHLSDLEDFERELGVANEQNDHRKAFTINESMEKALGSLRLDTKLVYKDRESDQVKMFPFPCVHSRLRDLKACIEGELNLARSFVQDLTISSTGKLTEQEAKVKMTEKALCMAICNNTRGFGLDKAGDVVKVKAEDAGNQQLPNPCVFVAVRQVGAELVQGDNSLRLICCDSKQVVGKVAGNWDKNQPIKDIHVDNDRQNVYIVQNQVVTVTDLAGCIQKQILASDLRNDLQSLCCIAGDSDKLVVAANPESCEGSRALVISVSKESSKVESQHELDFLLDFNENSKLHLRDRMLFIVDGKNLYTVCSITGLKIRTEAFDETKIMSLGRKSWESPSQVGNNFFLLFSSLTSPLNVTAVWRTPTKELYSGSVVKRGENFCALLYLKDGDLIVREIRATFPDERKAGKLEGQKITE